VGFFSNIANRIRSAWTKDKEQVAIQLAKGATAAGYPATGYDILQAYGYEVVADYLRLEQDLLARYVDYEEMDDYPEISAAIDIFADDATQPDTQLNRTVWVTSPNQNIQTTLDDMLNKRLRIDEEIWEIARTIVKYGNDFEELLVTGEGVVGLNYLPPPTVRRIEGPRGELYGFIQDFEGRFGWSPEDFKTILAKRTAAIQASQFQGAIDAASMPAVAALEDWEVVHFRLRGKHRRSIYGYSVLEAARWIWKRLMLLEDSALIYRLQRAPERYAFYVDVGNLPAPEALAYVNRVRQQYRKRKYVNPSTNKLDLRYDALSPDEDFFLPTRQGQEGTRIDVISSPQWQHMDDIEYFQNKLFSSIKIPKAYLAQDDNTARSVLSSEDVRFARTVMRIQRELRNGMRKMCRVHLAAIGVDPHQQEYEVNMTVPSSIFELAQLEVRNARADLASRMREFMSLYWVYKNVFDLSDEEIKAIEAQRESDQENEAVWGARAEMAAQKEQGGAEGEGEGGGGGAPPGMFAGSEPPTGAEMKLIRDSRQLARRLNGGRRSSLLSPVRRGSERELMAGRNTEAEKRAADKLERLLRNDVALKRSLNELGSLVRDLARSPRR